MNRMNGKVAPFVHPNCTGVRLRLLYTRATSLSRERYVHLLKEKYLLYLYLNVRCKDNNS
jgi:hypothetical protein